MTTAFPLFSLPFLPLKQVLDHFGPHGILYISMCSQKSRKIAIAYRGPSKDVKLELQFGMRYSLAFGFFDLVIVEQLSKVPMDRVGISKLQSVTVEMDSKYQCMKTYWEDRTTGLMEIGDYARKIFNRDIYEVMLGHEHGADNNKKIVDLIMKSQETIENFHCNFTPKCNEDLDYILETCKYTRTLSLFVKPSDEYCPARMPNFNVDILYLDPSFWIKEHHLLAMNAKYIVLRNTKLSLNDINTFLKHWMNGGCFQLKDLYVSCDVSIDYDILLYELEFTMMEEDVTRNYVNDEKHLQTIECGFDIKRPVDDVMATIVDDGDDSNQFWMVVWPDFAGNSY